MAKTKEKNKEKKLDLKKLSEKWNKEWEESKIYQPDLKNAKDPFYSLYMFPYPSAEGLHVGHAFSGTGADVYARFKRMQGLSVFQPMGFDAFGIHSENFALKIGDHPQNLINRATKHFREQFDSLGFSYDWSHSVNTSNPDYYKWTQWLFTTFFKAGLVEKKKASVNWCPSCKTVLADEQVLQKSKIKNEKSKIEEERTEERAGVCERCGTEVETRDLEQWFFKITKYADRLLEGLSRIDWTPKVKLAQKNWIGKGEGLLFTAPVKDTKLYINTFSAHFEAFYADTFVVIAPDHPFLPQLIEGVPNKAEIKDFAKKLVEKRKFEKAGEEKEPEGIFTGRYIVDPIGNGDLPIWVANYAIKEYGTGIVKCSAHDERDFAFAKKYGIRLKPVLFPSDAAQKEKVERLEFCFTDMVNGILSEPAEFKGKQAGAVRSEIMKHAQEKGFAKPHFTYHLRDWLISRQRYWGAPIPMIYCEKCAEAKLGYFNTKGSTGSLARGTRDTLYTPDTPMLGWFPVPDKDLPVKLPYIENFKPLGTGVAPLASDKEFVSVECPNCGSQARRETDVCDTFLDSSWYFLRYPSTDFDTVPFDKKLTEKWLPVHMYIGGAEHSVLHLLYSRFVAKVLFDLKLVNFDEPFTRFRAHGLIIKEGAKMSKSRGNVVNPDEYIEKYGPDCLRLYLMFLGPFDAGGDFRDSGMEGMWRFVRKIERFVNYQMGEESATNSTDLERVMNKTIKAVSEDLENLSYNTAIARIMEYVNALTKAKSKLDRVYVENLLLLTAPFAPYITEELYQKLSKASIHTQKWPAYDVSKIEEDQVSIAVSVNGKLRDVIQIQNSKVKDQKFIEDLVMKSARVQAQIEEKQIVKTIYVEGKILNIVVK